MSKLDEERLDQDMIALLRKKLTLEVESRCKGHMCATEDWLTVKFAGEVITEVMLRREECEGEWG